MYAIGVGAGAAVPIDLGEAPTSQQNMRPSRYPQATWGYALPSEPYVAGTWTYALGAPTCLK